MINHRKLKAKRLIHKLGGIKCADYYCSFRLAKKDLLKNEVKYWNDIRQYIYKCY